MGAQIIAALIIKHNRILLHPFLFLSLLLSPRIGTLSRSLSPFLPALGVSVVAVLNVICADRFLGLVLVLVSAGELAEVRRPVACRLTLGEMGDETSTVTMKPGPGRLTFHGHERVTGGLAAAFGACGGGKEGCWPPFASSRLDHRKTRV